MPHASTPLARSRPRRLVVATALILGSWTIGTGAQARPAADRGAGRQAPAAAAQPNEKKAAPPVQLLWRNRPSLRFGNILRLDLRAKVHQDVRGFSPHLDVAGATYTLERGRVGIQGDLVGRIEYEVEAELRDRANPWRDVFVNAAYLSEAEVQAGKFKVPFSLDQLTGMTNLDFAHRSLLASNLAPARDLGVMVHGRLFRRRLTYEAGVFRRDGDNARYDDPFFYPGAPPAASGRSVALRVTTAPLRHARKTTFRDLSLGMSVTHADIPEGLNSLRGRTVFGHPFFPRVYVSGRRLRLGAEAAWETGPFSVKGEFVRGADARDHQGLGDEDLSDLESRGWYVAGTWVLTRENKAGGVEPRRPFLQGGVGAVEVAARFDTLRFGSGDASEPPFRNPRAANVYPASDRVFTTGVNWYLNRWMKVQANAIRERIEDAERAPIIGTARYWSGVFRLQLVL